MVSLGYLCVNSYYQTHLIPKKDFTFGLAIWKISGKWSINTSQCWDCVHAGFRSQAFLAHIKRSGEGLEPRIVTAYFSTFATEAC